MRALPTLIAAVVTAFAALPCVAAADTAETQLSTDRFVAGGSVRQSRPVEGDLFGVGGNFDLEAPVAGDAIITGGDVRIRSQIAQDLYAAGGNVRIEAAIGHNARLAGGNVDISPSGSIGGNLTIGGGTVEIRGPVGGYVQVGGGDVMIDGPVGGDVRVASGTLALGPNARIAGKVVHRGPDKVKQDPGAQVVGGITTETAKVRGDFGASSSYGIGGWLWSLGVIALAGFIAGVFPVGSRRMGLELRGDPGIGLLMGFIALVCVPIAAIILAITIIGIPLAIAVLLLYFVTLIVGYAAVGVIAGDAALSRVRSQDATRIGWRVASAMAAMLVLVLLGRIPVLGGLVIFAALLAGLGAIILALRARQAGTPQPA